MRSVSTIVATLVFIGCGPDRGELAVQDAQRASAQRQLAAQQAYEQQMASVSASASIQRDQVAAQKRVADEQLAAANAQAQALQQSVIDRHNKDSEAIESLKKSCTASRENRLSHAKEMIIARLDAETRLAKNAKAIRSTCKLVDRPTGAVNVQSNGAGGFRVAPEMAADVVCTSLPPGTTKNDAWVVLARVASTGSARSFGPILQSEDHSPEDGSCAAFDREVGLDLDAANYDDLSSVKKLTEWKAP